MDKKQEIIETIKKYEVMLEMRSKIFQVIDEMKHYKQVNKRFTDKLRELGYHSYIIRDKWSVEFVCNLKEVKISCYKSCLNGISTFTWDDIIDRINGYKIEEVILKCKEKLKVVDKETEVMKGFLKQLEESNLTCYSLSSLKFQIDRLLRVY